MFVLQVGFPVVPDDPVGVSNWGSADVRTRDLSVQRVVHPLEQTVAQVHVADWVDALGEGHASRHLPVSVGPVVLNSFHVPLVHDHHNFLFLAGGYLFEQVFVSLVNEN